MSDALRLQTNQSDFYTIRTQNYIYVDKTQFIVDLFNKDNKVFMSRPRRFGKSLMVSTIKNLFLGKTDLFKGLAIEKHLDEPFFQKHPVIDLDFSNVPSRKGVRGMERSMRRLLRTKAKGFHIKLKSKAVDDAFGEFIEELAARKGKVVILIDEYDRNLVDNFAKRRLQNAIRSFLRDFYYQIKGHEDIIHAVYITGISKYAKMGVFSSANNIRDYSTDVGLRTMFGYTHEEVQEYFKPQIKNSTERLKMPTDEFLAKLQAFYDGYAFSENDDPTVYNPTSIHCFFTDMAFKYYWIKTGDQKFVENFIARKNINIIDFEHHAVSLNELEMPGEIMQSLAPALFLYQAGYLTPRKEAGIPGQYYLTYPNIEVRSAMIRLTQHNFFSSEEWKAKSKSVILDLHACLKSEDYVGMLSLFNMVFFDIPYDDYNAAAKDTYRLECFYRNSIFLLLYLAGLDVRPEEHKASGRVDLALYHEGRRMRLELKVAQTDTRGNLQTKLREAHAQMCRYVGPNRSAIPVRIVVSGRLRRIALASVNEDVYACAPDAKGSEAAEFVRIGGIDGFLASPWEFPAVPDDGTCGGGGQSAPQETP